MQTGAISLCDRIGSNIKTIEVKNDLLRILERFNVKVIQRHFHRLDTNSIKNIGRSQHSLCHRSNGNPYFLLFSRVYEDTPLIFLIDSKVSPNYSHPRCILLRGTFDESLFDDTLMMGEMVNVGGNGKWIFLINDLIAYRGVHLTAEPHQRRIELVYKVLDTQYFEDPIIDICSYQVKRWFPATSQGLGDLRSFVGELPYTTRGIYFWPSRLQYKPMLHNMDDSCIKPVIRKVKDEAIFQQSDTVAIAKEKTVVVEKCYGQIDSVSSSSSSDEGDKTLKQGERILWLRKTENPDVYEAFTTQNCATKVGVVCLPTLALSKLLRAKFKDVTIATSVPYCCTHSEKFQKWMPVKLAATA